MKTLQNTLIRYYLCDSRVYHPLHCNLHTDIIFFKLIKYIHVVLYKVQISKHHKQNKAQRILILRLSSAIHLKLIISNFNLKLKNKKKTGQMILQMWVGLNVRFKNHHQYLNIKVIINIHIWFIYNTFWQGRVMNVVLVSRLLYLYDQTFDAAITELDTLVEDSFNYKDI